MIHINKKGMNGIVNRNLRFQNKIEKFLTEEGIPYFKCLEIIYMPSGNLNFICCVRGIFVGIRLKNEGGQVSELQCYNLEYLRKGGWGVFAFYPDEFEDFKEFIKKLKVGMPVVYDFAQEVNSLLDKQQKEVQEDD